MPSRRCKANTHSGAAIRKPKFFRPAVHSVLALWLTVRLGRGFLTGQIKRFEDFAADDFRRTVSRFQGENFQKNVDLVAKVEEIARAKGCTPSQLALAWVLAQGEDEDIVPIPGTKRRKYLEENVGASNVKLTGDDLRRINEVFPKGVAAGQRYSQQGMKLIDVA